MCDKVTSTCELALGQSCAQEETAPKEPKKGFLKRKFKKIFGKKPAKPPEMLAPKEAPKPSRCAKYFERHGTDCIDGECCVGSFYLQDIPDEILVKIIVWDLMIPSPYKLGAGKTYAPPDGNSKHCCSGLGYQWPDGDQACVSAFNVSLPEKVQQVVSEKLTPLRHW